MDPQHPAGSETRGNQAPPGGDNGLGGSRLGRREGRTLQTQAQQRAPEGHLEGHLEGPSGRGHVGRGRDKVRDEQTGDAEGTLGINEVRLHSEITRVYRVGTQPSASHVLWSR